MDDCAGNDPVRRELGRWGLGTKSNFKTYALQVVIQSDAKRCEESNLIIGMILRSQSLPQSDAAALKPLLVFRPPASRPEPQSPNPNFHLCGAFAAQISVRADPNDVGERPRFAKSSQQYVTSLPSPRRFGRLALSPSSAASA